MYESNSPDKGAARAAPSLNRREFCLAALGGVSALVCGSCAKPRARRPNLVLVVLDTVRADHLSCWSYERRTSPNLDEFARRATLYRQARSTAPWTLPSHASMFTGQHVFQHGVEARLTVDQQGKTGVFEPPVPDSALMLAETLSGAGYNTAAFTANKPYMSPHWNFGQGFDIYSCQKQPGLELLESVRPWLRRQNDKPFFLFVNFMDAHWPYNTKLRPGTFEASIPQDENLARELVYAVLPGVKPPDKSLVEGVTAQYDMGIANADYAFSQLLNTLQELGFYDESMIILTSDHGEYLGEHMLAQHSKDLYEPVLHVPLVVKSPGQQAAGEVARPVSLLQVYGELLGAAKIEPPRPVPTLGEDAPVVAELSYSRPWDLENPQWANRFKRIRTAFYDFPWKLIRSSDGRHELYNLHDDPAEKRNRFTLETERAKRMMAELAAIKPPSPEARPIPREQTPKLTEEQKEAFKSGGYL